MTDEPDPVGPERPEADGAENRSALADFVAAFAVGFVADALWGTVTFGIARFVMMYNQHAGEIVCLVLSVSIPLLATLYLSRDNWAVRWGAIAGICVCSLTVIRMMLALAQ